MGRPLEAWSVGAAQMGLAHPYSRALFEAEGFLYH